MSEEVKFETTVYDKNTFEKLVNTKFTQIDPAPSIQELQETEPSIVDFFQMYNDLFYQIPQKGEINSHTYLIEQSSEYVNFQPNNNQIEAIQNQISQLRQQLLE